MDMKIIEIAGQIICVNLLTNISEVYECEYTHYKWNIYPQAFRIYFIGGGNEELYFKTEEEADTYRKILHSEWEKLPPIKIDKCES